MSHQWWPPEVQQREQFLYFDVCVDTYIFRDKAEGFYFAVGGIDPLGLTTIMMVADIVKYTSQRMKNITYESGRYLRG